MFSGRTADHDGIAGLALRDRARCAAIASPVAELHGAGRAAISPLIRFETPVKFATNRFSGLL